MACARLSQVSQWHHQCHSQGRREGAVCDTAQSRSLSLIILPRVKNNQNSPLLRLPPELRGRIWELVFGVSVLRTVYRTYDRRSKNHRLMPPVTKRKNALALLRACRQIYAETALLPYKSSIFSTTFGAALKPRLQSLKSFQRAQIEEIQFEVLITQLSTRERLRSMVNQLDVKKLAILPGLKRVGICVFCPKHISESRSEYKSRLKKCKRIIRKETARRLAGKDIRIMAGSSKQNWRNYHLK
jgi:hypothetical protein